MASTWQPGPVAWGIIATYILIVIQLTSLLMKKLPRRFWYLIHLTSYVMFAMASIHAFAAGTDASNDLFLIFGAMLITLVIALTVVRVLYAMRPAKPERSSRSPRSTPAAASEQ
jgi:DMSO/TMAO reductase YedYZ heme-binding membrane subunit